MSNDLEIIESLKKEGIELEEVKKLNYTYKEEGYIFKKNVVIELKIFDKIITENILNIIFKLTNLKRLVLDSNQIITIPNSLSNLSSLEWFILNSNQITTIPNSLSKLTNLRFLFLNSNQITTIPDSLSKLTNLKTLCLNSNQITTIPDSLSKLTNLTHLYLESNQITTIPNSLSKLTNLIRLRLKYNPLAKISDSFEEPSEIIAYLLKYQNSEKRAMNEVKVLVVGDERVGKTSVIRRLTSDSFVENETSTKGVSISSFNMGVRLNIWDFAGQQVTHTPHQYFMTEQSLYLLVLDAQVEDSKNYQTIRYWLDMIKSYAGVDVPIVVVVNKVDQNSGYRFDINRYRQLYPNIVEKVLYLSCKDGADFDKLKSVIAQEIASLKSVKEPFPVSFHNIKRDVEALGKDYIEDREYYDICKKHNISDESEQILLLKVLNIMGTVVSYSDSLHLDRTYVIDPEWLTNAVYEIIRSEHLKESNGILRLDDLSKILDPTLYKKAQYSWIISLMERFEVCFSFDNSSNDNRFLVPAVFENVEPKIDFEAYQDGFRLRFKYEFLPKSVISKFMVRSKFMIKDNLYWRDGVVLEYEGVEAVVKADEIKNTIEIFLINDSLYSREFLNIIRNELRSIGDNKLEYREQVPLYLPQHKGQFEDYKKLENMERKGVITNYFGTPESEEYEIEKLLYGYELEENLAKINKLIHYLKTNPSEENDRFLEEINKIDEKNEEDKEEKSFTDKVYKGIEKVNKIVDIAKNSYEMASMLEKLWM